MGSSVRRLSAPTRSMSCSENGTAALTWLWSRSSVSTSSPTSTSFSGSFEMLAFFSSSLSSEAAGAGTGSAGCGSMPSSASMGARSAADGATCVESAAINAPTATPGLSLPFLRKGPKTRSACTMCRGSRAFTKRSSTANAALRSARAMADTLQMREMWASRGAQRTRVATRAQGAPAMSCSCGDKTGGAGVGGGVVAVVGSTSIFSGMASAATMCSGRRGEPTRREIFYHRSPEGALQAAPRALRQSAGESRDFGKGREVLKI